ncbi:hypothetical protein RJT34_00164 [Clitoria ternatea]|uniref:Carboxypeptidase n=1 Tax=Clitoria ternatea TaxID=43366 RepID=A0AAN9KFP3_CLITE
MYKLVLYAFLLTLSLLVILPYSQARQADKLDELIQSRGSKNPLLTLSWTEEDALKIHSSAFVASQEGLRLNDKIVELPGQPYGVNFDHYSGYVTVDPETGRALFYYFVESPYSPSTKPLVLWLNGGPGCSSLGIGAFQELGPFRVNPDGKTLFLNSYAWNQVANVLFLESPAGVGFSYSNTTSDYDNNGDKSTAKDAYTFLINWLERFPEYKNRDFYITGESYAGHYVPQLAYTILLNNNFYNQTIINLKGIAIGNAWIDDATNIKGIFDNFWTHALNSDQTHELIEKYCDFSTPKVSRICATATVRGLIEKGNISIYNIYAPQCHDPSLKSGSMGSVDDFDPCSDYYVKAYLNRPEVQLALHAKPTQWTNCTGDIDGIVPTTASRYSINRFKLPIQEPWHPWPSGSLLNCLSTFLGYHKTADSDNYRGAYHYADNEHQKPNRLASIFHGYSWGKWFSFIQVGGYVVEYKGLTFVTVRGAGHEVPTWQPLRAFIFIQSFLTSTLPPASP